MCRLHEVDLPGEMFTELTTEGQAWRRLWLNPQTGEIETKAISVTDRRLPDGHDPEPCAS